MTNVRDTHAKPSVAVIGAAGYAGGELLRLLLEHPRVGSVQAVSQSQAGSAMSHVHDDLFMHSALFSAALKPCDVVFLCGDHGQSKNLIEAHGVYEKSQRVIDLSHDFRDGSEGYTYGLSEVFGEAIAESKRIANPGCFATALQLALAPLAAGKLLSSAVHITALTGSTGAGQKLQKTSHFSQRNQNVSSYKVFSHQHLDEIEKTLGHLQGQAVPELLFVPLRGPFTRGILASLYTASELSESALLELFRGFYKGSPFVFAQGEEVALKSVVNTNNVRIQVQKHDEEGLVHIVCCLDNLLKGASGQAVQNMNLMMGWPIDSGLRLKAVAY